MSDDVIPVGAKVRIKDPRSIRFGEVCEVLSHDPATGWYQLGSAAYVNAHRLGGYRREQLEIVGAAK